MSDRMKIKPAGKAYVARSGGAIIAESTNALIVQEDGYPERVYFPRKDVAMAFLDKSDHETHCPFKGDAEYFHIAGKSGRIDNAAWSYPSIAEAAKQFEGHLSFDLEKVAVEEL